MQAKVEIKKFLTTIVDSGYNDLIFYGAGEVAEIILQTISEDESIPIKVVGIIDDSKNKQGKELINTYISDISILDKTKHDAVLISSYTNHDEIYQKLINKKYHKEKILYFFK